ncbi:MAG: high-potential iron-sulfur protein [Steroidobacterales bacterium]
MSHSVSRRDALKQVMLLLGAAAAVRPSQSVHAAELPHLEPTDPAAKGLGYTHDAKSVNAKAFPTYKPGSICSNCSQFQAAASQAWGPCGVFPGKLVNANGWCQAYVKKA